MNTHDRDSFIAAAAQASAECGLPIALDGYATLFSARAAARFVLPNGLRVLLAPDDRAPVFAYQTWVQVGSRDEDPSRTGLAHLCEHLMFKGTRQHPSGEFDREMERRGTQTNAATWVDWTYYHEALAARDDNLATVVDFEVDRMCALVLDAETFASELEVVKNERRMAVDDSVGGTLNEQLYALAFDVHPYRSATIGSMAHLEQARPDELERFYRTFYAPNNAVVVIAGALEVIPTLRLLARRYGALAPQKIVRRERVSEPRQNEPREAHLARQVVAPQIALGFHGPAQRDDDFAAVQLLSEALVEGDNARLYRRLVTEEKIATEVEGALMPFAEPGLYEILLTLRAGADAARAVALVQEELDALATGLCEEEIDKARHSLEVSFYESWRSPAGVAENLGHFEANFGDFAMAARGHERLLAVSEADLRRVATEIFRRGNRSCVVAHPTADAPAASSHEVIDE